jgi:hypothetical protein
MSKLKYRIHDIIYDDGPNELPKEFIIEIDKTMGSAGIQEEGSEHISKETGYSHFGFSITLVH